MRMRKESMVVCNSETVRMMCPGQALCAMVGVILLPPVVMLAAGWVLAVELPQA
jgi:hypothetical protein